LDFTPIRNLSILIVGLFAGLGAASAQKTPIQIVADLSDAPRKMLHAEIDLPVAAGPLTLTSPKWIPGHHMPSGPISQIVGVVFTANGQPLTWRRDDVDLYQFHLTVPEGVTTLHAHLDCIVTARISQKLAVLEWEDLMLYPAHLPVREIPIQPSVKVPAGWGIGTALTPASDGSYPVPSAGATTRYTATTVEQLEDSPVITGEYFHEYQLAPTVSPRHFLDVVADDPKDSELRPEVLAHAGNLVREADALYGSHHYNVYHFLLTLSDVAGGEGLEHGQSSNNGVGEKGYSDAAHELVEADLLPHEFTHSWNGKYRRPEGLYQPDFATPQQGALLWVYEGLTQYYGNVLAARAGFETQAQFRDRLATTGAALDATPGRQWRATEDTAVAASILRGGNPAWSNLRRGQDYYTEGNLVWLDADTLIRKLTNGSKSLDDFAKIFLGKGGNTGPLIVPYSFEELVQDLNQVAAYDWAKFLRDRIENINPHADLDGVERGGYKLIYKDEPSATDRTIAGASPRRGIDCWYSVGLRISTDGSITDVRWNSPADKARLAPGEKIMAVDDRVFSADAIRNAIRAAKGDSAPIHLIVQADTFVHAIEIDYHDGEHFPALERVDATPDMLSEITKPLTKPEQVTPKETGRAE
jgi:predicted metalloprotease with PDZ domain